jgi:hypothetical protein
MLANPVKRTVNSSSSVIRGNLFQAKVPYNHDKRCNRPHFMNDTLRELFLIYPVQLRNRRFRLS